MHNSYVDSTFETRFSYDEIGKDDDLSLGWRAQA